MSLFLLALLSFLMGILASAALPFLQHRQAQKWRKVIVEDALKEQQKVFEKKLSELTLQQELLVKKESKLKTAEKELIDLERKRKELLGGEPEVIKEQLLTALETKVRKESRKYLETLRKESLQEAKKVVLNALHRLSLPELISAAREKIFLTEPSLKGRIVGPEGKNIRLLEERLEVKILLDVEPSHLVITSWDSEKRWFAKKVLESLLSDGKIFPKKIEETIERVSSTWEAEIILLGQQAFRELNLFKPADPISLVLGKLSFRYSLGQNLLDHSKEVGLILGRLAGEMGFSETLGKRIGLLHDIGKALVAEDRSHALAGMKFLASHGESEEVSNGVGCHHFEVEPITEVGSLCHLADALSAGKEGARGEPKQPSRQKFFKHQPIVEIR